MLKRRGEFILKEKWMVINRKTEYENLNQEIKLHPLIARLLSNRDISTRKEAENFLYGSINDLLDPYIMKDMKGGISFIKEAIINKKKIIIYGDYDCDGVCSTAILYKTLKNLDANCNYYIPNREEEGYGINSNRIRKL